MSSKKFSHSDSTESIEEACELGILEMLADEYILSCYACENRENETKEGETEELGRKKQRKKSVSDGGKRKFPNVAGFCRYYGIGRGKYERLSKKYPDEFEKLSAVFEDEALNSEISPSLLSTYLKRRLGYDESSDAPCSEIDTGQIKLIFDHDVFEDGE